MKIEEEFRDIKGYEGEYQISNIGRLKSLARLQPVGKKLAGRKQLSTKILKPSVNNSGYLVYVLKGKCHTIHRLVAQTFIPNPECLSDINHIDGNKQNNCVDNLEWVSHQTNMRLAGVKISKAKKGHKNKIQKYPVEVPARPQLRFRGKIYNNVKELAKDINKTEPRVYQLIKAGLIEFLPTTQTIYVTKWSPLYKEKYIGNTEFPNFVH